MSPAVYDGEGRLRALYEPSEVTVDVKINALKFGAKSVRMSGALSAPKIPFECGPFKGYAILTQLPDLETIEGVCLTATLTVVLENDGPTPADFVEAFTNAEVER